MIAAERTDLLAIGGKLAALVTALLPVAGFLSRLFSFGSNPTTSGAAENLAWSAPISQLAATGFFAVILAAFVALLAAGGEWIDHLPTPGPRWFYMVLLAVILAGLTLLAPWPYLILFVAMSCYVIFLGRAVHRLRRQARRLTDTHAWWATILVMGVAAICYGLLTNPDGVTVAKYVFAANSQLANGKYAQLGEDGATIFIQSCDRPAAVELDQYG